MMELKSGTPLHNSSASSFSLLTFPNVVVSRFEERNEIPKVASGYPRHVLLPIALSDFSYQELKICSKRDIEF